MADETIAATVAETIVEKKPVPKTPARPAAKAETSSPASAKTVARTPSSASKTSAAARPAAKSNSPEIIGKYKIMGLVAKGGMGAVYKGVHPTLKRMVILKKLTIRNNATVRERFKREAQILLDMQSPYIVHLFDYFVEGSSHYIVEEFVDGLSLAQVLEKQVALGTEVSLLVFLDACYALKFAHQRGIVHRDIKPGNILISRRAEVKLADFGIAASDQIEEIAVTKSDKIVAKVAEDVTQSGVTLGTPAYMSPEQIEDSRSVDQRADIFSMGVMLYEMLTGTKPFPSKLSEENLEKIKKGRYINPRQLDHSIPKVICKMIKKMLKANPEKRYQSIDSVIAVVKKYLAEFDTHQIRISLAQIVATKNQFKIPDFEKKSHFAAKISGSVAAALALALLGMYGWKEGAFHATVLSHWYKPVTLNLITPVAGVQNNIYGMDVPVKAYFFYEDEKDLPEVQGTQRDFNPSEGIISRTKTGKRITLLNKTNLKYLSTKPAYFKNGNYRVKVLVGSYLMWRSFKVDGDCVNINFDNLQRVSRPVKLVVRAYDSVTGESLLSGVKYSVMVGGKYVPIENVPESEIKSGKVLKILTEAAGYKPQEYSMIVDWYQDSVFVTARLEKK
ncbi:MAG: serine/threonine protein kinase [Treponema sp.]|nr:serine/threonine protein kinase [Candidatus Treponema equifaecale]